MRAKVAERRSRINLTVLEDLHGEQFLKAIDIVLAAVSEHCKRFATLARDMAAQESRELRRDELLAIAENCEIIAHEPPKTFWQALQLCYFIQLILQIESNGHSVSFGRMDQYLYPYYRRDVELQQSLDREQAIELLHCCWLKLLEVNKIRSGRIPKLLPAARCTRTSPSADKIWSTVNRRTPSTRCRTRSSNPAAACALPSRTSACVTTPG